MEPTQPEQPVYYEEQPPVRGEPVVPARPVESVEPVRPVEPVEPVRPEYRRRVVETDEVSPAARVGQVIYVILGIVIALIIIRVILKALAANTGAAFTSFIYNVTDPLVAPFQGIFSTPATHGSVFEFSSLVAIVIYALIAWAIVRLIDIAGRRRTTTT